MTPNQALAVLGVDSADGDRSRAVRVAYAAAVKADHPDHGGAGTRLAALQAARNLLLSHSDIVPCRLCRGMAYTKGRFGVQVCTACNGTGDQR